MSRLSEKEQYRAIVSLVSLINGMDAFDRLLGIAAYSSLYEEISERNLMALLSFAHLDLQSEIPRKVFRFYTGSGQVKVKDEGLGFSKHVFIGKLNSSIPSDQIANAKKIIENLRREILDR